MWKFTQRSWVGGRLDAELMGRQDLQKYFQGASELKNFSVRRQGYISKRRGTELACDLEHLLGHSIVEPEVEEAEETEETEETEPTVVQNTIVESRIIPIVASRETGYFILMTANRAFLLSKNGIRLMDGSWAQTITDYELTDYADEEVEGDKRPYYISVPYADSDIKDLDYAQSGDTIFLAHRKYAPAKIVRLGADITHTSLEFSASRWAKPRITDITASGNFGSQTSALKTVYYMCTYVKDGIESEPSQAVAFSYRLPWGNGATLTVTCDKGANETEPDYYNIYKKDSSDYGLIATSGSSQKVVLSNFSLRNPDEAGGVEPSSVRQYYYIYHHWQTKNPSITIKQKPVADYINTLGLPIADATWWDTQHTNVPEMCGGVQTTSAGLLMSLGNASGQMVSVVTLNLDAFYSEDHQEWGDYYNQTKMIKVFFSGTLFRCTLKTCNLDGTNEKTFYSYATATNPNSLANGENTVWSGTGNYNGASLQTLDAMYQRTVSFDFTAQLKGSSGYPDSSSTSGGQSTKWQVKSIKVEAYSNAEDPTQAGAAAGDSEYLIPLYFHGIGFDSTYSDNNKFIDDYVTPDMSLTPPQTEEHFHASGEYPACVGLHQQRLAFASSYNDPFTLWMSMVGDIYNFNTHSSIREDDALTVTLAATENPDINHIIANRDLMLLADSGEWKIAPVTGNTLSYKTISADMQSAIGCSKSLKPLTVGDEVVFADRIGQRLYATRYNWSSDGYESNDLTVLSQWMFKNNPIVSMAYRQHPDSTIECVLADGTMATLVYMKEHEVCAWSRQVLGGGWVAKEVVCDKAISNGSSETVLLVERNGKFAVWRFRDEIPIRESPIATPSAHIHLDAFHELRAGEMIEQGVMASVTMNGTTYVGYPFEAELVTVRPEPQGNETIQFEIKNAKDCEVRILDSGDFTLKPYGVADGYAQTAETGAGIVQVVDAQTSTVTDRLVLKSIDVKKNLVGNNTGDGRVQIKSGGWMPLDILSVSTNYEIQPLSGSEG